jgi:hypothetical protein
MGSEGVAPLFFTSTLDGGEWSAARPDRFIPKERALCSQWIGGDMGPRVGLDAIEERKSRTVGNLTRTVQLVAVAIPTPVFNTNTRL